MILTDAELASLTRRTRPTAQARVLRALGIPFRYHPTDGGLLVAAAAARAALTGVEAPAVERDAATVYTVNVDRLRARHHGKTSKLQPA